MGPYTIAALLAIAPLSVLAQSWFLLVSSLDFKLLYPSEAGDECGADTGGITITTETVPRDLACIDVEAIFGGDEHAGFLNDTVSHTVHYHDNTDMDDLPPPGIYWCIPDNKGHRTGKDCNGIWFEQRNQSADGKPEEGEDGRWVVTIHPNRECTMTNVTETPWYESSCQTGEEGLCESVSYSIKGIGIRPYGKEDFGQCQTWAEVGAATGSTPFNRGFAAVMFVMAFLFLM